MTSHPSFNADPPLSNFTGRLGTNYAPTDEELVQISGIVRSAKEELASLELTAVLLEARIQNLRRHAHEHDALLSPIRRLPPELLLEVFRYLRPASSVHELYSSLNTRQCPWVLGQVCSAWRTLVHDCPELWTFVRVGTHLHPNQYDRLHLFLLESQLKYGQSRLLDVDIEDSHNITFEGSGSHPVQLIQRSDRWRTATLDLLPETTQLLTSKFPNLKKLVWKDRFTLEVSFLDAPMLSDITLVGYRSAFIHFPWAQLTTVTLTDFQGHPDVVLIFLEESTRIEKFSLQRSSTNPFGNIEPGPSTHHWKDIIHRSSMRELIFGPHGRRLKYYDSWILRWLSLPSLQTIHYNGISSAEIQVILNLIQSSNSPVQDLHLYLIAPGSGTMLAALINMIVETSKLRSLHLSFFESYFPADGILESLLFCPSLETLVLSHVAISSDMLVMLLESHRKRSLENRSANLSVVQISACTLVYPTGSDVKEFSTVLDRFREEDEKMVLEVDPQRELFEIVADTDVFV